MLVLNRKKDQRICIGEDVRVKVVAVNGDEVRLGIEAPADVRIDREELRISKDESAVDGPQHRPFATSARTIAERVAFELRSGRPIRSLTVQQPYASLIACGDKRVENRPRPIRHRGLLAIHAGVGEDWMKTANGDDWSALAQRAAIHTPDDLPRGGVVAIAWLSACVGPFDPIPDALAWVPGHRHASGPSCWVLDAVAPLPTPVPCRGQQGIWQLPPKVATACLEQLEGDVRSPHVQTQTQP